MEFRPTIPEDIFEVSTRIRASDRAECWAAAKWTPEEALWAGLSSSEECVTALVDGEIVCIFGVVVRSLLSGCAVPWLLGTNLIEAHGFRFLREARRVVDGWLERYPVLVNFVDARNTRTVAWLQWLGFAIAPALPYGPLRLPFHRFTLTAPSLATLSPEVE